MGLGKVMQGNRNIQDCFLIYPPGVESQESWFLRAI